MRNTKSRLLDSPWRSWTSRWLTDLRPSQVSPPARPSLGHVVAPGQHEVTRDDFEKQIGTTAFAFRGYDVTNLGRGPELLEHPVYGRIVQDLLDRASVVCSEVVKEKVDLAERVRAREPSTLATFLEDIGAIVAMELAQVQILEEVFGVPIHQAGLSFGHSIGELSALVLGGMYEMEQLLPVPLLMARDCAELTADTVMGILSSQGGALEVEDVQRLCASISSRGHGLVGPSTYLSPYQVLLLGRGDTLDLLEQEMADHLPGKVSLRRRPNLWPPLHTPLVRERNIPNRAAMALYHIDGGHRKPTPTVVSCTTGRADYDEWNSRDILTDWTDHPQRLWDVMENTLASGVELVVHVGPDPKLIPSAFDRLSGRIMKQLKSRHLDRLGRRVIPSISRNHWLNRKLPTNAVLLRAPFVNQVVLEDWLLAQEVS